MAKNCCHSKSDELTMLAKKQVKVLWIVLLANLTMFFLEVILGYLAESTALMGDSLDMLGDTFAYASSLYVVGQSLSQKAKASIFKATIMILLGLFIFIQAIYNAFFVTLPDYEIIGGIGFLALTVNAVCLFLLTRHRDDDINFRSVWICSRNDIIANTSVILAAFAVYYFQHPWPDLIVGLGIMTLFLKGALGIFSESFEILNGEE